MVGALIILMALLVTGGVLYLFHRRDMKRGEVQEPTAEPMKDSSSAGGDDDTPCCGMHITCEKDSLLAGVSEKVEYFDDEELDRFIGRKSGDYSESEIDEFRDVLLTLIDKDVAPWARSIQLRGIELPDEIRDELLLMVAESRR